MVTALQVQREALAYRRAFPSSQSTNDKQYGGQLFQYEGLDRVRKVDDEDCYYAIRYPDKEPASYADWEALMFAPGMDKETRKTIMSDVAGASWSHVGRPFAGTRPDCEWLAKRKCAIAPWTSAHYEGQRKLPRKRTGWPRARRPAR